MSTRNNKLTTVGSIELSDEIGKNDIIANVDFKQCPTNETCSGTTSIQIKDICNFLTGKSLLGNKFGQYFVPPVKCPVKPGTYKYNLTMNLKQLARLPFARFRTHIKLVLSGTNVHKRQTPFGCYEAIISMKG